MSLLARRLAEPEPGADEYLAAATVLAMKYGPAVLDQVRRARRRVLLLARCLAEPEPGADSRAVYGFSVAKLSIVFVNQTLQNPAPLFSDCCFSSTFM